MNRRIFLQSLSLLPLAGFAMKIDDLNKITENFGASEMMPALFVGHGSPMNAIEENEFVRGWKDLAAKIPKPKAVLCISAHWETKGTFVTVMEKPKTIHDFGGFPQKLFEVQYPAPGNPALARETKDLVKKTALGLDDRWGLDHGTWSILTRMYPEATTPVIQLSLDYSQSAQFHYDLACELAPLRKKGVLIIGSGNIVHNLRMVAWDKMNVPGFGFDWALEANDKIRKLIISGDHQSLINYRSLGKSVDLAIPTPEHYLPLLYALALQGSHEKAEMFNDKAVMGSLTMTSVKIAG